MRKAKQWKGRKSPYLLFRYSDGSSKTFTIKFCDLREDPEHSLDVAQKVFEKVKRDLRLNLFNPADIFPDAVPTLHNFCREYLEHRRKEVERGRISAHTLGVDRQAIALFIEFSNDVRLPEITGETVNAFVDWLRRQKNRRLSNYKNSTINSHLAKLAAAFEQAKRAGHINKNPFAESKPLPVKKQVRFVTDEELTALRRFLSPTRTELIDFALYTGMRINEIYSARCADLDTQEIDGDTVYFLRVTGKGRGGGKFRWVPLEGKALDIFRSRCEAINAGPQVIQNYLPGKTTPADDHKRRKRFDAGHLFFEYIAPAGMRHVFGKAKQRARITSAISFHSLRHTFAVKFLEEQRPGGIYRLQQILGHSSISTTEGYLHATAKILALRNKL